MISAHMTRRHWWPFRETRDAVAILQHDKYRGVPMAVQRNTLAERSTNTPTTGPARHFLLRDAFFRSSIGIGGGAPAATAATSPVAPGA